jgi:hypothetical protein
MVEKCGSRSLQSGVHIVYVEGFQAGGGVGMEIKYSGPDTRGAKVIMQSGVAPSSDAASRYYKRCSPTNSDVSEDFTVCMFRSEVDLSRLPEFGNADTGKNRLYFIRKATMHSVDVWNVNQFRKVAPSTPEANYAWVIYGQLKIGIAGSYTLCITSDDGYFGPSRVFLFLLFLFLFGWKNFCTSFYFPCKELSSSPTPRTKLTHPLPPNPHAEILVRLCR